jgi:hypothetical protein
VAGEEAINATLFVETTNFLFLLDGEHRGCLDAGPVLSQAPSSPSSLPRAMETRPRFRSHLKSSLAVAEWKASALSLFILEYSSCIFVGVAHLEYLKEEEEEQEQEYEDEEGARKRRRRVGMRS